MESKSVHTKVGSDNDDLKHSDNNNQALVVSELGMPLRVTLTLSSKVSIKWLFFLFAVVTHPWLWCNKEKNGRHSLLNDLIVSCHVHIKNEKRKCISQSSCCFTQSNAFLQFSRHSSCQCCWHSHSHTDSHEITVKYDISDKKTINTIIRMMIILYDTTNYCMHDLDSQLTVIALKNRRNLFIF